jgi:hypothetical protein
MTWPPAPTIECQPEPQPKPVRQTLTPWAALDCGLGFIAGPIVLSIVQSVFSIIYFDYGFASGRTLPNAVWFEYAIDAITILVAAFVARKKRLFGISAVVGLVLLVGLLSWSLYELCEHTRCA